MEIIWHGHSCFSVCSGKGCAVLDPYADGSVPGYPKLNLEADLVLCSHEHADHGSRKNVTLTGRSCEIGVETVASWHDEAKGAKRGPNTIHILKAEGMKLIHLGDLGCALDEAQKETLVNPDVLMIPVGGFFTIDAEQAFSVVQALHPRVVIPMHYRFAGHGYDVISTLDPFLRLCENPVQYPDNRLTVTAEMPAQTAILHIA